MNYEEIKKLMEDMEKSTLTAINIELPDGTKISMKKESQQEEVVANNNTYELKPDTKENDVSKEPETKEETGNIIKSPMVGNFYIKASPSSEPYVEVGSLVEKGDTVCIIEAMKLMNEIESEFSGKITEIFVKDGEPVEYGSPLFRVE